MQGYLAHRKQPPPLGPPWDPRCSPTVGSWEGCVSYERGTPVTFSKRAWLIQVEEGVTHNLLDALSLPLFLPLSLSPSVSLPLFLSPALCPACGSM